MRGWRGCAAPATREHGYVRRGCEAGRSSRWHGSERVQQWCRWAPPFSTLSRSFLYVAAAQSLAAHFSSLCTQPAALAVARASRCFARTLFSAALLAHNARKMEDGEVPWEEGELQEEAPLQPDGAMASWRQEFATAEPAANVKARCMRCSSLTAPHSLVSRRRAPRASASARTTAKAATRLLLRCHSTSSPQSRRSSSRRLSPRPTPCSGWRR